MKRAWSNRQRNLAYEQLELRRVLAVVDIPDNLTGAPAAIVSAPINIDTANGIRAAEIRLSYDTAKLDLTPSAVTLGTVWSGSNDAQITANVDDAAGTIVIFVSSSSALPATSGSLVQLGFRVASTATAGATAVLNLTQVALNEGTIAVSPAPTAGADAADGLITVVASSATDRITGFVYADTNSNNTPDSLEGIIGVTITLTNSSGVTRTVTTGANGSYEFTGVTAGSYTITQTQPNAYLDGGTNALTATLVAGTALTNQNFRELGLGPAFLYSRLLTTTVMPVGSSNWTTVIAKINSDATAGAPSLAPSLTINPAIVSANSDAPAPAAAMSTVLFLANATAESEGRDMRLQEYPPHIASYPVFAQAEDDKRLAPDDVDQALLEGHLW